MPFNMFPYSNLHNFNLDWILGVVKTTAAAVKGIAANVESWAARIQQAETNAADAVTTANNAQALVGRAVRWDVQSLTDVQKTQARTNIDAASPTDIPDVSDVVRYSPQTLTPTQQTRARLNIGATSQDDVTLLLATKHYVKYDEQTLTDAQKAQARNNIGAISSGDIPPAADAVLYTAQQLTEAQQVQARSNIGAISSSDIPPAASAVLYTAQQLTDAQQAQARANIKSAKLQPVMVISNSAQGVYTTQADFDEILLALTNNVPVWISMLPYGDSSEYLGTARLVNNGTGISATLTLTRQNAESLVAETWYNVSWLDGDPTPVLTVTTYQGRMVPNPTSNDAGKVLAVNSLGSPGWEPRINRVTDTSSTTPTITSAADNTIYEFTQDLTSLSLVAGSGAYSIIFTSGATPTVTKFPATILGLETFAAEANTIYEINVMDNRAVVGSWEVSA